MNRYKRTNRHSFDDTPKTVSPWQPVLRQFKYGALLIVGGLAAYGAEIMHKSMEYAEEKANIIPAVKTRHADNQLNPEMSFQHAVKNETALSLKAK